MPLVQIVSGIIEDSGKFLLVTEGEGMQKGRTKFPTEHVRPGELPVDALIRGIKEETGYVIINPELLEHYLCSGSQGDELDVFDFYARKESGIFVPNNEIREVNWVDLNFLKDMQTGFSPNTTHYHRIDLLIAHKGAK